MTLDEFKKKIGGRHTSNYVVKLIRQIPEMVLSNREIALATKDCDHSTTVFVVNNIALQYVLSSTFGYPTVTLGGFDTDVTNVTWTHGCLSTGLYFELVRIALSSCKCRIVEQY